VILATGSVPASLPFLPFDGRRIVSSTEALSFPSVPARLLVVGAGAIGLEMGSVWSRLGSTVTVIELTPQILPGWDGQIAQTLARLLARQGISIHTSMSVTTGRVKGSVVELSCRDSDGKDVAFEGDEVLVAVGRKPSSEGLGLEEAGIERDRAGRVVVDAKLRTSLPGVYAIGDLVAGPMLAHKAEEEGIAAAETISGGAGRVEYGTIPSVVYTSPEAASVGATEERLKTEGVAYAGGSFVFRANGRALALNRPDGFVKVLSDARTDRVLGVHILGAFASDMIAEAVAVMAFDGAAEDIARIAHAHPSLPEITREAALAALGRPINAPPKAMYAGRPPKAGTTIHT
jgi:dihydrolipoamide dehydrogenase